MLDAVVILVLLALAYVIWVFASARGDRPWKLRRRLRSIARFSLGEKVSLRDFAARIGNAVGGVDDAIITSRSTARRASWCLVLDEGDRVTPFLVLVHAEKHEIEVELRSGQVLPPAPRVAPSRRVLEALDKALLAIPGVSSVRWTRDRKRWHDRPFDG